MGGTIVTPVIIATALTRNLTACQGNPRATPTSTAPRVNFRVRVPWHAVEVRGRFRGMPWKVLPLVVPRQCRDKGH